MYLGMLGNKIQKIRMHPTDLWNQGFYEVDVGVDLTESLFIFLTTLIYIIYRSCSIG
jgi:hypothetical protein